MSGRLDHTVGELLPAQLPKDADPRFAGVTVKQLLTMTSGLAGDDRSLGGDSRVEDAMSKSSDWVRHILSRRLVWEPGTQWAYSNASSHLLSAIVANASGQSTLEFARAKLFNPLGIRTDGAFEPVLSDHILLQLSARRPVGLRKHALAYQPTHYCLRRGTGSSAAIPGSLVER
jgi:CubicO group peptidase (beta-lactamase class C family)